MFTRLDYSSTLEMWFLRRMLRISYKDRVVTHEEVLRRANVDRILMKDIVKR